MIAVDLFAGAGGFSTGALQAGVQVAACANHWRAAIDIHQANHPECEHICANLLEMDMGRLPAHDLLLASPACQGFSTASQPGRRPKHAADRNTMWAVLSAAEYHRPRTILVENVRPLLRWALLPSWEDGLARLGYVVRRHLFDVAAFGVPQNRQRVILSARLEEPLDLVEPGHHPRAFGPFVDWEIGDWRSLARSGSTPQRVAAAGRARGLGDRFLLHYDSYHRGRELDRPIGTITTKVQWALVDGDRTRMLSIDEHRRAMGFPDGYVLPAAKGAAVRMLGNAIPPAFAADLIRQATTDRPRQTYLFN